MLSGPSRTASSSCRLQIQRLVRLIKIPRDGPLLNDAIGRILQVNHRLQTMFGQAERDLVGSNIGMLIPPPYADVHDGTPNRLRRFSPLTDA